MQDEYPQYLKLQAPCGSYNLVITVNLSTNTNSKMHPASSASNFKWELKNTLSFWYFCQCNLKSFLLTCRKKNVIIKKNTQIFPITTIQLKEGGGNTTNNSPDSSKAGKETHITCERCKITCQCLGFQYFSECGRWFNTKFRSPLGSVRAGEAGHPRGPAAPAISIGLEGCEGTPG